MFSSNDTELAKRHGHMRWVSRINRALDEDRFRLSFQPITPVIPAEHPPVHYELLIRMQDEFGNMVAPGAFLPAAELYSLSTKLDRWVLSSAFAWLDKHPRHVDELSLCAINLSGHSLGDEQFLDFVVDLFEVNLDTAEIRNLTQDDFFDANPWYAADGKTLLYNRRIGEYWKIFSVDRSGRDWPMRLFIVWSKVCVPNQPTSFPTDFFSVIRSLLLAILASVTPPCGW